MMDDSGNGMGNIMHIKCVLSESFASFSAAMYDTKTMMRVYGG